MSLTIRPAVLPDEVDAVAALIIEEVRWHGQHWPADFGDPDSGDAEDEGGAVPPPLREQLLSSASDPSATVLVAEVDGAVAGVLSGHVADKPSGGSVRYEGPIGFVGDLMVSEAHRGRGVGAALLGEFEAWARTRGAAHLRLFVHDGNTGAEALYQRAGFRRVHVELRKDL